MKCLLKPKIVLLLSIALTALNMTANAASKGVDDDGLFSNMVSEQFELSAAGSSGMLIEIVHKFGDIEVTGSTGTTIRIVGEKKVSSSDNELAEKFLKTMEVRIKERGNRLLIETYYPEKELSNRERKRIKKFSISYSIEIPENAELKMNSSFGNIDLDTLTGRFSVTNGFGRLSARMLKGDSELNNKFGHLSAVQIDGGLRAYNEHGSLDISEISGNLVARTSFGSAKVYRVRGDVHINNSHGAIDAEDIGGKAQLETSFGSLDCRIVRGSITARNSHGAVTVARIKDNADITTSFGRAFVKNVGGSVSVENQHGGIDIENVGGDVRANTSFGSCNITKAAENVTVTNQHSSINAVDLLPPGDSETRIIRLKTSHGSIKASFPEDLSAKIDAFTSFGKFKSDFPVLMTLTGSIDNSSNQSSISGSVGDGRDRLELEGTHGNVNIEKSRDGAWRLRDVFPGMDSLK